MHKNVTGKDLTKEAPRSPRIRVGGYAILGRTIDKCRALVAGNIGEYHFDCPLDNMLFGFKGVKGDDFKAQMRKARVINRWRNGWIKTARRKRLKKSNAGVTKSRRPTHTTIRSGAIGSPNKSNPLGSTRRRRRCSTGWRLTTKRATQRPRD